MKSLLPSYVDYILSHAGAVKLTKINTLPCSQNQLASLYKKLFAASNKAAFDVCITVMLFVHVSTAFMRDKLIQRHQNIMEDLRVGTFGDRDRS